MLLDTTFLIDVQREAVRKSPGPAFRFLRTRPESPVRISVVTYAEFAEGFPFEQKDLCSELLQPYQVLDISPDIAWQYAQVSRRLRQLGRRIGDNDLWIACTALHGDLELVTRDAGHFRRVPNLKVIEY